MFLIKYIIRTYCLLCCLTYTVHSSSVVLTEPRIISIEVNHKLCIENISCKYYLNVRGSEFLGHYSWRLTPNDGATDNSCNTIISNYEISEVETLQWISKLKITTPYIYSKIYFCLYLPRDKNIPFGGKWVHQGQYLYLDPKNDQDHQIKNNENHETTQETTKLQSKGDLQEIATDWGDLLHDTDVNYLPKSNRPSREESKDIEVFYNGKYRALDTLDSQDLRNYETNELRAKRNADKNINSSETIYNTDSDSFVKINGSDSFKNKDSDDFISPIYHKAPELSNSLLKPKLDEDSLIKFRKKRGEVVNKDDVTNESKDYRKTENNNSDNTVENVTEIEINIQSVKTTLKPPITTSNDEFETHDDETLFNNDTKRKIRQISHPSITENNKITFEPTPFKDTMLNDAAVLRDELKVEAVRIEKSPHATSINDDGIPQILEEKDIVIRLIGEGLTENTVIAFTTDPLEYGSSCKFMLKGEYKAMPGSIEAHSALFKVQAPPHSESRVYVCAKNLKAGSTVAADEGKYIHQGSEAWKCFIVYGKPIPVWIAIILIIIFLMFSALFSGLNLGLMSLDKTELKIISNTGTEEERKHARAIMPVRDNGNFLLCSILLGNVAVNATLTIMLDSLTSGLFAVVFSTILIVLLGEITPQAICSRHGLVVGAKTIMITKAVMMLTAPMAYPLSKALDGMLGEEIGNVYNRERLKELVKVTTGVNDLDRDEVNIISGALELRKKTVQTIMTKLEDAFMLPITAILDFKTMSDIINSGFSRIPVYEGHRGNIVTVLFIKDLAFVDPDDNTPLKTLCQYYMNPCNFVFEDVTLDVMFRQFKEGHKGHMAFVHRINNEGDGDPFYETIGLVTLEDVIEEMIQAEIVDETDVFVDNRSKLRRKRPMNKVSDFSAFAERHENQRIHISPQMTLATFQYLNSTIDAFRPNLISETVLRRLLKQDVIQHIKVKGKDKRDPAIYVYQQGKPVDYFVLILEGRVEVTVGRENLMFEAGPFTCFGQQALIQNVGLTDSPTPSVQGSLQNINMDSMLRHTFVPDYSVRAVTDVVYLTVKRSLYLAAKRATLMEKGALSKGGMTEQIDNELDKRFSYVDHPNSRPDGASTDEGDSSDSNKLLMSVDEDNPSLGGGDGKSSSRQLSPNPPVSASPVTRATFASPAPPETTNGDVYRRPSQSETEKEDEQEKLLKEA